MARLFFLTCLFKNCDTHFHLAGTNLGDNYLLGFFLFLFLTKFFEEVKLPYNITLKRKKRIIPKLLKTPFLLFTS